MNESSTIGGRWLSLTTTGDNNEADDCNDDSMLDVLISRYVSSSD